MLEGKKTNLRVAETDDIPLLAEWSGDPQLAGAHQHYPVQVPAVHFEDRIRLHEQYHSEWVDFIVEDKSGAAVGWAAHYISAPNFGWTEIGFAIVPSERNRGYASEAASMLTDYLFLTKDVPRVQAVADAANLASVRVLEKSGFRKEGVMRRALWNGEGVWADGVLYAILRDEWGSPRILSGAGARTSTGCHR